MLQHCVEDLHVVGIPGIGQLVEDHQLHRGAKVVSVGIEQLPGESVTKQSVSLSHCALAKEEIKVKSDMRCHTPDTQHVVVEEDFGFESDLDQVGDHLHVVRSVGVAVHTQRHEEVLSWSSQLCTHKNKERQLTLLTVINIHIHKLRIERYRPLRY